MPAAVLKEVPPLPLYRGWIDEYRVIEETCMMNIWGSRPLPATSQYTAARRAERNGFHFMPGSDTPHAARWALFR